MGCFDTIVCKYRLPGKTWDTFDEQTKDYDCGLNRVTIQPDGVLTRDYGKYDPATVPTAEEWKASAGWKGFFALRDKQVWLPDVRRVDFTGTLTVDGVLLFFDRGKVVDVRPDIGYPDPFTAPSLEPYPVTQPHTSSTTEQKEPG